jgi:hypothetical protein
MKITRIYDADLVEGQEVTVWWNFQGGRHNVGQGGYVHSITEDVLDIVDPLGNHHTFDLDDDLAFDVEEPYAADECLDYDPETCSGAVELRWPGEGERSWPRCQHHGDEREARALANARNYPDSPIAPPWFDEADAGERWDDDY